MLYDTIDSNREPNHSAITSTAKKVEDVEIAACPTYALAEEDQTQEPLYEFITNVKEIEVTTCPTYEALTDESNESPTNSTNDYDFDTTDCLAYVSITHQNQSLPSTGSNQLDIYDIYEDMTP